MAVKRTDEVLDKALPTDATVIPRYDIVLPNGSKVAENAEIMLKNPVLTPGMPVNRQAMNECLAASGSTTGTATALTLAQDGFALSDGALVRFKLHIDSGATPTLNVNGTGAKAIMQSKTKALKAGTAAGTWLTVVYSSTLDFFVLQGSGAESSGRFGNDLRQISTYELFFRGNTSSSYCR